MLCLDGVHYGIVIYIGRHMENTLSDSFFRVIRHWSIRLFEHNVCIKSKCSIYLPKQLWFTRIALLVKLRRFSLAEVECQYFNDLDAPDLYFEFYPELYGGRKGSMVPFGFRFVLSSLFFYLILMKTGKLKILYWPVSFVILLLSSPHLYIVITCKS